MDVVVDQGGTGDGRADSARVSHPCPLPGAGPRRPGALAEAPLGARPFARPRGTFGTFLVSPFKPCSCLWPQLSPSLADFERRKKW